MDLLTRRSISRRARARLGADSAATSGRPELRQQSLRNVAYSGPTPVFPAGGVHPAADVASLRRPTGPDERVLAEASAVSRSSSPVSAGAGDLAVGDVRVGTW